MLSENYKWNIINEFFKKKGFVSHQIDTFNDLLKNGIPRVITESDIVVNVSPTHKYTVSFDNVYIPNPSIIEEDRTVRQMFPAEARQRDLTYDSPIFVNVIEKTEIEGQDPEVAVHNRVIIGRLPIMLLSNKCNLKKMTAGERIHKGECEKDYGGYFIIRGKERVLIGQLRGIYNQPMVFKQKDSDKWKYICEVRSMSEETGHSVQIQTKICVNDRTIVFSIPYIKEAIPVGIIFKALGLVEDEEIANIIGSREDDPKFYKYVKYIIRDSAHITTQEDALRYISDFIVHHVKDDKKIDYTTQVVENELLPHMGIFATIKEKSFFLGMMVNKLILTSIGLRKEDDRDNYANKRVEMAGVLCCELFRTLFKRFIKNIIQHLEKKKQYPDILNIISRTSGITSGLKSCFSTGSWSVTRNNYVRTGVSQVLSRLTFAATLSHLRRVVIPIGKEGKNSKIRQIHSSQVMYICNCVTGDTEVLLGDGKTVKPIKDLDESIDEVMSIHPKTLKGERSKFFNKFSLKNPEAIYEIETISGRKVKCTPEHPFLVNRRGYFDWIVADDLIEGDVLMVKHYTKFLPCESEYELPIIDIRGTLRGNALEILTTPLTLKEAETCARLYGLFMSRRYMREKYITFDNFYDMNEVIEDIMFLGFKRPTCRIGSECSILVNREIVDFMKTLQFDYANKFGESLPRWLLKSPPSVKREFLSALQGSNAKGFDFDSESETISIPPTSLCALDNEELPTGSCASQILRLFRDLGIKSKISIVNRRRNDIEVSYAVIDFDNSIENVLRYCDVIWYRYSYDTISRNILFVEFLKAYKNQKFYSYERFKELCKLPTHGHLADDAIFCPIAKIRKDLPIEPVYDFTTKSDNHSFMVNSVVGSNCETPE